MSTHVARASRIRGFTMVETLVALFVLAIGVLGVTALHATSLRGGSSSHYRSQAALVAYDLMDRLRANRNAALDGDYNLAAGDDPPTGDGAAPLADDDLADWFDSRLSLLPGGSAVVACAADGICTVSVIWNDSRADPNAANQQFDFTSEI